MIYIWHWSAVISLHTLSMVGRKMPLINLLLEKKQQLLTGLRIRENGGKYMIECLMSDCTRCSFETWYFFFYIFTVLIHFGEFRTVGKHLCHRNQDIFNKIHTINIPTIANVLERQQQSLKQPVERNTSKIQICSGPCWLYLVLVNNNRNFISAVISECLSNMSVFPPDPGGPGFWWASH